MWIRVVGLVGISLSLALSTFGEEPTWSSLELTQRAKAVLISAEDWEAMQETLYLLAVPGMRESIKQAMAEPLARSKRSVKW